MKKLLLLAASLLAAASLSAQISVGEHIVSGNVGIGNIVYGSDYDSKFPPITASYEYGLLEDAFQVSGLSVGVGGQLSYTGAKDTFYYDNMKPFGYKYSSIIVAAKAYFHYDIMSLMGLPVDNLDTYATFALGYNIATGRQYGDWGLIEDNTMVSAGGLVYGFQIGARYWFSQNMAANAEIGMGLSLLTLGLCYSF